VSDVGDFQARQERWEPGLIEAILAWIAGLRAAISIQQIIEVLAGRGVVEQILPLLIAPHLELTPIAADEGRVAVAEVPDRSGIKLSFNMQDPHFEAAVYTRGLSAATEIDVETKDALRRIVADARAYGHHPNQFAPTIAETIGLTERQAVAVHNFANGMIEDGAQPERALVKADAYAKRLRRQRAMMIARTETIAAANIGRMEAFEQAARNGWVDRNSARLEWMAVQDDPNEICFHLDGQRASLDGDFQVNGVLVGPPPVHPNCRCVLMLVTD